MYVRNQSFYNLQDYNVSITFLHVSCCRSDFHSLRMRTLRYHHNEIL